MFGWDGKNRTFISRGISFSVVQTTSPQVIYIKMVVLLHPHLQSHSHFQFQREGQLQHQS